MYEFVDGWILIDDSLCVERGGPLNVRVFRWHLDAQLPVGME